MRWCAAALLAAALAPAPAHANDLGDTGATAGGARAEQVRAEQVRAEQVRPAIDRAGERAPTQSERRIAVKRGAAELYFAPGAIGFDHGQLARLQKRLPYLVAAPDDWRIVLEGHADAVGERFENRDLARTRAEYVRKLLVRAGVPAEKIVVHSRGEAEATVGPREERAGDRRVVVRLIPRRLLAAR